MPGPPGFTEFHSAEVSSQLRIQSAGAGKKFLVMKQACLENALQYRDLFVTAV